MAHDDVREKKCEECGHLFRSSSHLNRHKRVHTNEKVCVFCRRIRHCIHNLSLPFLSFWFSSSLTNVLFVIAYSPSDTIWCHTSSPIRRRVKHWPTKNLMCVRFVKNRSPLPTNWRNIVKRHIMWWIAMQVSSASIFL